MATKPNQFEAPPNLSLAISAQMNPIRAFTCISGQSHLPSSHFEINHTLTNILFLLDRKIVVFSRLVQIMIIIFSSYNIRVYTYKLCNLQHSGWRPNVRCVEVLKDECQFWGVNAGCSHFFYGSLVSTSPQIMQVAERKWRNTLLHRVCDLKCWERCNEHYIDVNIDLITPRKTNNWTAWTEPYEEASDNKLTSYKFAFPSI